MSNEALNWQARPLLWQHFRSPVGAGGLVNANVIGVAGSAADGSMVELHLNIENTGNGPIVSHAGFLADGGVAVIAAASWVCEALTSPPRGLVGFSVAELGGQLQSTLELQPVERAAALLVEDALQRALSKALSKAKQSSASGV